MIVSYKCGITVPLNTESWLLDAVLSVTLTVSLVLKKMVGKICHLHLHRHHSMMAYTQL